MGNKLFNMKEIMKHVSIQLEDNYTILGNPQAFLHLDPKRKIIVNYMEQSEIENINDLRSLEIIEEQSGLQERDFYFFIRIHCSDNEYDNYERTVGVMDTFISNNDNIDDIEPLLERALEVACCL